MGLSQYLFLLLIFFFKGCNTTSTSHESVQLSFNCHDEETSALLEFKKRFTIDESASGLDGAYPKVSLWKPVQGGNSTCCCTWDGVECDEETGHVIGLDLSSSCLYGSINSNSSLFRLVHLQRLNLSDNHFQYSQIPTTIRNFRSLTHLNLSGSVFSGRVPSQLSQLVKLSSLDLAYNIDPFSGEGLLKLDGSNFKSLVQNLTSLQKLHLSFIDISSPIPHSMANLSSLTSLLLRDCGIFGEFPIRIFELQNLNILSVRFNQDLIGHVPKFNRSSPLMSLYLTSTGFSGNLPSTIEKLHSLNELDLNACNFSGLIPFSLGNLKQLNYLDLSENRFTGPIPASLANLTELTVLSLAQNFVGGPLSWVGKQTKLTVLDLSSNNLIGDIPSFLENLTQLTDLNLNENQLTGPIPSWVGNLSRLFDLYLGLNKLHGSIPESLFNLRDLNDLHLHDNGLTGVVDIFKVKNITLLQLGENKLEVITESKTMNAILLPKFRVLGLGSCNVKEFPSFLRYQQNLLWLDLRGNKLHGKVPKWMWNTSTQTLEYLDLGYNFLTGFDLPSPVIFPWVNLQVLKLRSNMLYGPVPIPSSNIKYYSIWDNRLVGEISPLICNLSTLQYLDLSNNKLSGMLPQCLGNFSDELKVLNLRNNSFRGILPQTYTNNLRMIDVSDNKLQGKLPRSMAHCLMLEFIVLSENQFSDVFPFWLGNLPELKLLAMNHNGFYGVIENPQKNLHFSELRILDISYNNFRGEFPSEYIFSGNAMRGIAQSQPTTYMETISDFNIDGFPLFSYMVKITITNKGAERYYEKIREDIGVVDISSNNFEGNIPEFIGNRKGLRFLNISHNSFTGSIPSVLGNLILLEALDLSQNQLSGDIPKQLAQLTSLAYFNVSYNHLTGSIPQGPQFQTFESTSFEGNPGLCGDQLPKKCGNSMTPAPLPPSSTEEDDSGSGFEFDWMFVLAGFGSGLVVGVVLADQAITRKRELFLEIVGMLIKLIKRITSKN